MVEISVTLQDGTTHSWNLKHLPKHWKSWIMYTLPYGLNYEGCTWNRKRI